MAHTPGSSRYDHEEAFGYFGLPHRFVFVRDLHATWTCQSEEDDDEEESVEENATKEAEPARVSS